MRLRLCHFARFFFQPLVHDVIEQLVPSAEQHYQSLIRRFVGAVSCEDMRDDAIYGELTLARCVDGFLR